MRLGSQVRQWALGPDGNSHRGRPEAPLLPALRPRLASAYNVPMHGNIAGTLCRVVRPPGLDAAAAPARHAGCGARRRERAADRAHRRRQDAGRVPAHPGRSRRNPSSRPAHAVCQPAEGAGHRHRPQPAAAGGADGPAVSIETRTGDTPANRRARQRAEPPNILLTTPESLAVLLSLPDAPQMFAGLACVVMDEVHALAGTKRGDQLALGRGAARHAGAAAAAGSGCRPRWRIRRRSRPMPAPRASSAWPTAPRLTCR